MHFLIGISGLMGEKTAKCTLSFKIYAGFEHET